MDTSGAHTRTHAHTHTQHYIYHTQCKLQTCLCACVHTAKSPPLCLHMWKYGHLNGWVCSGKKYWPSTRSYTHTLTCTRTHTLHGMSLCLCWSVPQQGSCWCGWLPWATVHSVNCCSRKPSTVNFTGVSGYICRPLWCHLTWWHVGPRHIEMKASYRKNLEYLLYIFVNNASHYYYIIAL